MVAPSKAGAERVSIRRSGISEIEGKDAMGSAERMESSGRRTTWMEKPTGRMRGSTFVKAGAERVSIQFTLIDTNIAERTPGF